MPTLDHNGAHIYYEEHGEGFPVLLFAPGGMRSSIPFWRSAQWDPIEVLSPDFRVIAMDQRNAGRSTAPVEPGDGWAVYTADHLALLDHLGVERCHLLGGCIGGPYCFGVIEAAPERVAAAVLQQPIGNDGTNAAVFGELFNGWADELKAGMPDVAEDVWDEFRANMFGGDFLYNVSREFVRACQTPLLVLMGNDPYHPESISREIVELAPNAELVERWKEPEVVGAAVERVVAFLRAHTQEG